MEKIYITRDELNKLSVFDKGGYEGQILLYDNDLLLKHFEPYLYGIMNLEDKMYKLERLNQKNLPSSVLIKPEKLVFVEGQFEGYLMRKMKNVLTVDSIRNMDDLLKIYSSLYNKLDMLHKNGITVGDLKPANILVDLNMNPVFIDVDSMGVDEYEIDNPLYKSKNTRTITNVDKFFESWDRQDVDKLLLLACFINSLNFDNKRNLLSKLFSSDLSDDTKRIFCKLLNSDTMYLSNKEFSEMLHSEYERRMNR